MIECVYTSKCERFDHLKEKIQQVFCLPFFVTVKTKSTRSKTPIDTQKKEKIKSHYPKPKPVTC